MAVAPASTSASGTAAAPAAPAAIAAASSAASAPSTATAPSAASAPLAPSKPNWSRRMRMLVAAAAAALVLYFIRSRSKSGLEPRPLKPPPPSDLARRLADAGWVLFVSPSCPWCSKQMEVLGGEFRNVRVCADKKCPDVSVFPTWQRGGQRVEGMQDGPALERLLSATRSATR